MGFYYSNRNPKTDILVPGLWSLMTDMATLGRTEESLELWARKGTDCSELTELLWELRTQCGEQHRW